LYSDVDHNVSFSEASRGQRGYHQAEVDAFVARVQAGAVTPAEIQNVAFAEPPPGQRGYAEDEVDAYLDLARGELSRQISGQGPEKPRRYLLYRISTWTPATPALAIDVDNHAIRVVDLSTNATLASVSLMHVTATPAQHGGGPVLILEIPDMPQLAVQPHLIDRFSVRRSPELAGRLPSEKSEYLVLDEDWFPLLATFGVDPDLENLPTPRKIYSRISDFFLAAHRPGFSWQWFVLFGVVVLIPGLIYLAPPVIALGVASLIMAAVAWYFGWGQRRGG
jgi:DivIVA domain-containing protein